jgi:hypothetical protein
MNLFHFQEEAPGSVFWHGHGWTLFQTLINYMRRRQDEAGYIEVNSPELLDRSLWETSGHLEKFGENMFTSQTPDERIRAEADELPGARADLQERLEVLSRTASEGVRIRQGASLRALRRPARADAGALVHPGRRPHLHHRGPDPGRVHRGARADAVDLHDFGFDDVK